MGSLPMTHLQEDQAAALTSIPEKYLEQDDLVVLKLFQTALKEQNLGQPMGEMNIIQFPVGKGPTVSGAQPCGSANVCSSLPPRSYVTMVKNLGRGMGGNRSIFKEGSFFFFLSFEGLFKPQLSHLQK